MILSKRDLITVELLETQKTRGHGLPPSKLACLTGCSHPLAGRMMLSMLDEGLVCIEPDRGPGTYYAPTPQLQGEVKKMIDHLEHTAACLRSLIS